MILPSATRIFHSDLLGHLIAEANESGTMLGEYIYFGDQPLVMIRPGEVAYYYHNDHLDTPQILTDETGTVSWKAFYTPFGEAVISVETVENPFRFPGQYCDQETGLHYNWNRYYDPQTGRYLTPDPIGLEGGINLFVYVANNPINRSDPEGMLGVIHGFDCRKCLKYQDKIRKNIDECRSEFAACKTDADIVKFGDKYGGPSPDEAIANCAKEKATRAGDIKLGKKMLEECIKERGDILCCSCQEAK